ncbi:MAG: hypothetical protein WCF95_06710 [bacterium]
MTQSILERGRKTVHNHSINSTNSIVELTKKYIFENDCPQLSMDVSDFNIIDASKVIILCSTYHYAKYPHGEIAWVINSSEVKNLVKSLNLGNIRLITA